MTNEFVIDPAPDDWHAHLRFGAILKAVAVWSAKQFKRTLAMGNVPAVETVEQARAYEIETNAETQPHGCTTVVAPKLTLETSSRLVDDFADAGFDILKLYLGITTGSADGIVGIKCLYDRLETMQSRNMVLCVHMESADQGVDFDQRERVCLAEIQQAVRDFPKLRFIIEHISCAETVEYLRNAWRSGIRNVAGSVTLHHFKHNKNDVYGGEVDPHLICKPPIQGFADQRAIQNLVLVDKLPNVFAGSDTAPHDLMYKGPDNIRSGVLNVPVLMPEWLRIFLQYSDIQSLANFHSIFGADYYQIPRNKERLVMSHTSWTVPHLIGNCRPYMAGKTVKYQVEGFI